MVSGFSFSYGFRFQLFVQIRFQVSQKPPRNQPIDIPSSISYNKGRENIEVIDAIGSLLMICNQESPKDITSPTGNLRGTREPPS